MQQRMQPPGDNKRRTYSKRTENSMAYCTGLLWHLTASAQFLPSSLWLQVLYLISVRRSVSCISSFPGFLSHLTCDRRPGNDATIYTGSTCVILIPPHLNFRLSRPQTKLLRPPCGLHACLKAVRKTIWRCKGGARVLFLPVNYVLSWSGRGVCLCFQSQGMWTKEQDITCHQTVELLRLGGWPGHDVCPLLHSLRQCPTISTSYPVWQHWWHTLGKGGCELWSRCRWNLSSTVPLLDLVWIPLQVI